MCSSGKRARGLSEFEMPPRRQSFPPAQSANFLYNRRRKRERERASYWKVRLFPPCNNSRGACLFFNSLRRWRRWWWCWLPHDVVFQFSAWRIMDKISPARRNGQRSRANGDAVFTIAARFSCVPARVFCSRVFFFFFFYSATCV